MSKINYHKLKQMAKEAKSARQWGEDFLALMGGKRSSYRCGGSIEVDGVSKQIKGRHELTFETKNQEFNAKDIDIAKLAYTFMDGDLDRLDDLTAEGGASQVPSQFVDIGAFEATVGGILDMIALKGYNYAPMISDHFCHVIPRTVRGGKLARIYANQKKARNIPLGQPAPKVDTMQEGWVELPYVQRDAKRISLLREDFTFERSGTLQQAVEDEARGLRIIKEERIAERALGIVNDYVRDGVGSNGSRTSTTQKTFLTSANTSTVVNNNKPFNYVNAQTSLQLATLANLATGEVLLRSNVDPYSNIPIDLGEHPLLFVSPQQEPVISGILWSMMNNMWSVSATQASDNSTYGITYPEMSRSYPNKFSVGNGTVQEIGKYRLCSSWIWYNMLTTGNHTDGSPIVVDTYTNGSLSSANWTPLSGTNAQALWMLVNSEAFAWLEVYPFSSVDVMIAGDDAASNVVQDKYFSQYGEAAVIEPRYVGQFGIAVDN